jgi:SAM-dependent methyltransferase
MMTMARNKSFDRVAADYDAARPGYPDALYDRIIEFASLRPETKVLEVGVGTGKATVPFAKRGFDILGIEPGKDLSAIARANLTAFPRVRIATIAFEAWAVERGSFDLAFSAQAFHWLDRNLRLPRFAEALRTDGVLAVFGNFPRVAAGPLRDDLDAVYRALAPSLASARDASLWYASAESSLMTELTASPHFCEVEFKSFMWDRALDGESYCRLLSTYSEHSTLPPAELHPLLTRVADVVRAHGTIMLSYTTGLFLARRSK